MQRAHYAKEKVVHDASHLRVGIVVSSFNADITESMLQGAKETLHAWKVPEDHIDVVRVPGSFELPYGCLTLLKKFQKPHAIITLGCVIKGETDHDQYVARAATDGILSLSLKYHTPISFGVITTNTLEQAVVRSTGDANKGKEAAETALTLALL